MKERLRKMFLEMLNQQMKQETGNSTGFNLHMVEVQLLKDLFAVLTGMDRDDESYEYNDWVGSILVELHRKFDC